MWAHIEVLVFSLFLVFVFLLAIPFNQRFDLFFGLIIFGMLLSQSKRKLVCLISLIVSLALLVMLRIIHETEIVRAIAATRAIEQLKRENP